MGDKTTYVTHVIEETWRIKELYRQTAPTARVGGASTSLAVAVYGSYNSPSTDAVLKCELDSKNKNPSSSTDKSKWILSLSFTGAEWKLSLGRKSKTFMEEPLLVQLEMKVLNRSGVGAAFFQDSMGPFWLPSHQKFQPTQVRKAMHVCYTCCLRKVLCSCKNFKTPKCSDCCLKCFESKSTEPELSEFNIKTWSIGCASQVCNNLDENGSLAIYIRLEQLERSIPSPCDQTALSESKVEDQNEKEVICDLNSLFTSGIQADLIVKVKGEVDVKLFRAHKCILAARSTMLQRFFAVSGRFTSELEVENTSADAVGLILKYIYCGSLDLEMGMEDDSDKEKFISELLHAADKWELVKLKESIGRQMISCCDATNALKLLEIANKHQLARAVSDIEGFIQNNIEEILAAKRSKKT